jgi:hypothetical protein
LLDVEKKVVAKAAVVDSGLQQAVDQGRRRALHRSPEGAAVMRLSAKNLTNGRYFLLVEGPPSSYAFIHSGIPVPGKEQKN